MSQKKEFFNKHAEKWDQHLYERDFAALEIIFSKLKFSEDDLVLDVGAGTGILVPYLKKAYVKQVIAIDIAEKMVEQYKINNPDIEIIHGDYCQTDFKQRLFDKIIIFNAFPHFNDSQKVFEKSSEILTDSGELIIAHSMSREDLNELHRKAGVEVEKDVLIPDQELKTLFETNGFNQIIIENRETHFFSRGVKRQIPV